ncbi:hypothetical protein LPJ71_010541, partial [Coemansia sp. S17]
AKGVEHRDSAGQPQHCDGADVARAGRPRVLFAGDAAVLGADHRARAARRHHAGVWRADGAELRRAAEQNGRARQVQRARAGHVGAHAGAVGGPRSVRVGAQGHWHPRGALGGGRHGGGRAEGGRGDRVPGDCAVGVRAGRAGVGVRGLGGGAGGAGQPEPGAVPADPGGEVDARVEGGRVRGGARRAGQLRDGVQHGELRPAGRAHGRLDRRGAQPDAERRGVPHAAHGGDQDRAAHGRRRRVQRAVRAQPAQPRVLRHRDERAPEPQLGAGVQGDGLPAGVCGGQDRARVDAARAAEQRDDDDHRVLRAEPGLRRHQDPALGPGQVQPRGARHRLVHEVGRRGHGDRPDLRGVAAEGHPLGRPVLRGLCAAAGRDAARRRRAGGAAARADRPAAVPPGVRDDRARLLGRPPARDHGHRPLVPAQAREHLR